MENKNTNTDNLLYTWMPNIDEMIKLTLHDNDIPFYPITMNNLTNYKAFDITTQKSMDDEGEDFVAVDQKLKETKTKKPVTTQTAKKPATTTIKKPTTINKAQPANKQRLTQTIQIAPEWKGLADFNKQMLEKLRCETEPEVEDLLVCGNLYKISDDYEKDSVNPLNPAPLQRFDKFKFFDNMTTSADEKMKGGTNLANVFVTDKILSVIMTMVYNSRPWHLKITKVGDNIFIDQTDKSEIDLVTVNETSENMPAEDTDSKNIDSFNNLAIEATLINEFIKEQLLDPNSRMEDIKEPHPFTEEGEENVERVAYKYRLWRVVIILF
jgi:hypothetical protein